MVKTEKIITIKCPIEEVFDYISNLENGPEWQSGLEEVRCITNGPLGVGTHFTSVRKFMGRKLESEIELTTFELNKEIAFKTSSGASPFEQSIFFETTAEGTKITSVLEMQTGGLMGLAEPLIASGVKREFEVDFNKLKEMLESRVTEAFELLE
jgi:uncharacterized membrane protein